MTAKFLLTLLVLNGLWCASASASTLSSSSPTPRLARISNTISALIGLDPEDRFLVDLAIDRALVAQADPGNPPRQYPITAGVPLPVPPRQPTIRGRTTKLTPLPSQQSIGQSRRNSPNVPPQQPSSPTDNPPETNQTK
jgi:hypothetical protein